jgi:hypothetical protein
MADRRAGARTAICHRLSVKRNQVEVPIVAVEIPVGSTTKKDACGHRTHPSK